MNWLPALQVFCHTTQQSGTSEGMHHTCWTLGRRDGESRLVPGAGDTFLLWRMLEFSHTRLHSGG